MAVIRALFDSISGQVKPLYRQAFSSKRKLNVFPVPCGDCNGCILEVMALKGAAFDISASGLNFVDHPANANILLITGVLTRSMVPYLEKNWEIMPEPKAIVTVGACAIDKCVFEENYAVLKETGGGEDCILEISGCPPTPVQIIEGLLKLLGSRDQNRSDLHPLDLPLDLPLDEELLHQPLKGESFDNSEG